ncbi:MULTISPECIES: acetolactate synthase small subunit [Corynebacterium]|uniref:acetolactate synthase small subunit n=1 Tax=Corynebacterium TaxID=1716 RepID=UPI00124D2F9D|nr:MULTISPECIES: acetolactate synthase small subunit [Corynebacterium]
MSEEIHRHTLSVLVQDVDGIISRVAGLFSRRAYTMSAITSARTETRGVNRITIVVHTDDDSIEQITKQLNKLIHVLKVVRLEPEKTIARALLMVKVNADAANRPLVVDAANLFRARVVDVAPDSMVIEATGAPDKLDALLEVLEPFGIREMAKSGQIAMHRGPRILTPNHKKASQIVDFESQ